MGNSSEQDPAGLEDWVPASMRAGSAAIEQVLSTADVPRSVEEPPIGVTRAASDEVPSRPPLEVRDDTPAEARADATDPPAVVRAAAPPVASEQLTVLEERLSRLEAGADGTIDRLDEIEQISAGGSAALDGVGSVQQRLIERLESLEVLAEQTVELRIAAEEGSATREARLDGLGEQLARLGDQGGRIREQATRLEKQLARLEEQLQQLEQTVVAEAERGSAAQRAVSALEERTSIVLDEFRERLQIQSDRLSESDQAGRDRLGVVEQSFDAAIAGLRSELDQTSRRDEAIREELQTLTEAVTTRLGELGARVAELEERRPEPAVAAPSPLAAAPPPPALPPSSLDEASFEELRAVGLSVTQAARFIGMRSVLGRQLAESDIDEVAGLQEDLRERLREMLS